jgi:DNA-binding NarL/FixJ family response regulator
MKYSIIHAERDFHFFEKLKNELTPYKEFQFTDHCCYYDAALQSLNTDQPSILITASKLLDETKAVEAFCEYRDMFMPDLKIVVLTSKENVDHFITSMIAGVQGYISKSSSAEEIYQCLRSVVNGENYLGMDNVAIKK